MPGARSVCKVLYIDITLRDLEWKVSVDVEIDVAARATSGIVYLMS